MRRYIENAIFCDFLLILIIGLSFLFFESEYVDFFKLPTKDSLNSFEGSIITVSATLLGFLLTIITVLVTFKKGFEDKFSPDLKQISATDIPNETIFDKKISKQDQFYGTQIHKHVVDVFVGAAYEIGIVLFILLIIQSNIFGSSIFVISVISFCCFILTALSIIRSLLFFKLFLKVHLHSASVIK